MSGILQDLRYALRMLAKSRSFAVVAILTLALGIGANTAIFSVVHTVLLKPLPYPDPSRLTILREYSVRSGPYSVSWMNFLDWRQQSRSFVDMAAYRTNDFNVTGLARPEVVHGVKVTSSFFPLINTTAVLGRTFSADEDKPGVAGTVVLSYGFWRTRLGADSFALGKSLILDGQPYTIVGVLRPDFAYFPRPVDLIVPAALSAGPGSNWLQRGNHPGLTVLARLRSGISLESARAEMDSIMARLESRYPDSNNGQRATIEPLYQARLGDVRPTLLILLAGVASVLLIACFNVANLSLGRSAARQREFAVRAAIGAGRRRIVAQLLGESILLSLAGGALGLLLAVWATPLLLHFAPANVPRLSETRMDAVVFGFSFLVVILTGILSGLAPAFQSSRIDLTTALRETAPSTTAGTQHHRFRNVLLVCEVATAMVLVVASGLLTRSLWKALAVNPGFRADHLLALDVNLLDYKYKTEPQQLAFVTELLERTRHLPAVESASAVLCPPLVGTCWESIFLIEGRPVSSVADLPRSVFNIADSNYFRTMEIPLLRGRWFTSSDTANSAAVAIINETAARRWWPGQDPIGKRVKPGFPQDPGPYREIVGVVGDVKQSGPDQEQSPEIFQPETQTPMDSLTLVVRTAADPLSLSPPVEEVIHSLDPDQPAYHVKAMTDYLAESLAQRRFSALLLEVFGALALLLAAVGIYSVISFTVTQRTHEFGVRMALGARQNQVLKMVLAHGARLSLIGVIAGTLISFALMRTLASLLFGISAADPLTFAAVAGLLICVALLACLVPARNATKVDPNIALRYE